MASNELEVETSAVIDDAARIKADSLTVSAANSALKPWLSASAYPWLPGVPEWNVKSGSGGLFDLPAARSDTTISQQALVRVGDAASIVQTGSTATPGTLSLGAGNQVIARDKVKVNSGGAIAVPGADSAIRADVNIASVQVGYKVERCCRRRRGQHRRTGRRGNRHPHRGRHLYPGGGRHLRRRRRAPRAPRCRASTPPTACRSAMPRSPPSATSSSPRARTPAARTTSSPPPRAPTCSTTP